MTEKQFVFKNFVIIHCLSPPKKICETEGKKGKRVEMTSEEKKCAEAWEIAKGTVNINVFQPHNI